MQPVCDDYFKDLVAPGGSSSAHLNPGTRAYLAAVREYLLDHHDRGLASDRVNEEHADLIDRLLRKLFRLTEDRYFENFPRLNFRLGIVAVGGYGRREQALGSDVDLLFLHRGKLNPYVETIAEAITTRLWDGRLVVGAATRNLHDCLRVGNEDLATLTSYLDMRFLIGDPELFAELSQEVRELIRERAESFVAAKLEEQRERHERFGESLYLLQPNLRESVGGLRDYHTAMWVARATQWEVRKIRDLRLHGFVDDEELCDLQDALRFVWRLRNELHRKGRKDDRLHYDAQERIAERFGYQPDAAGLLPVEKLMRDYYVHARAIERVSRRVVELALLRLERRKRGDPPPVQSLADGFALAGTQLEIPSATVLRERPPRLLAAFAVAQHHDVDVSARAQRMLRQNLDLVDDAFRSDPECAAIFRQILNSPLRVYRSLKLMDEVGLLGAYLPEFARVVGLWQHDMYHTYTVDVHSLFLIEQLRRIQKRLFAKQVPLATALMREVRQPDLLYLGCMLHDIGKGLGGGHSEKGARMIAAVARRLGLAPEETRMVEFLVRHHLTMSAIAERRNPQDPKVILRVAEIAGSRARLRNLYLITVADIRSVSPEAWTEFKANALAQLYRNTSEWLEAAEDGDEPDDFFVARAAELAESRRANVERALGELGVDVERAQNFLDTMPPRYLANHAADEIASQLACTLAFLASQERSGVYTFRTDEKAAHWGIVVFARDQPGLFARTAGVISSLGHNILSAEIYTTRQGLALEIYRLDPAPPGEEERRIECERIDERWRRVFYEGESIVVATPRRGPGARAARPKPPVVRIDNNDSDIYTVIDVIADDRPGLLYDIARVLAEHRLEVGMSRVATRARRVTDVFYVTDRDQKLHGQRKRELERALLAAVGPAAP